MTPEAAVFGLPRSGFLPDFAGGSYQNDGVDAPSRRHRNVPRWQCSNIPRRRGHPLHHFGTIGAKNFTRPKTAASPAFCTIDRIFGAIRGGAAAAPRWPGPLLKGIPGVSFARTDILAAIPEPLPLSLVRRWHLAHPTELSRDSAYIFCPNHTGRADCAPPFLAR
jgi:hypothetical protein